MSDSTQNPNSMFAANTLPPQHSAQKPIFGRLTAAILSGLMGTSLMACVDPDSDDAPAKTKSSDDDEGHSEHEGSHEESGSESGDESGLEDETGESSNPDEDGGEEGESTSTDGGDIEATVPEKLQFIVDNAVTKPEVPSAFLFAKTSDWEWSGAAGVYELGGENEVDATDSFILHSVTKSFTATAVLIATEQGQLNLDAPISDVLSTELLTGLHVIGDTDSSLGLTLRQLLSHRSGLADYFFDGAESEDDLPPFFGELFGDPTRIWQPEELIDWTRMNLQAVAAPGESYHYSDTGYVLAGLALEAVYEKSLHEVFQELIFQPLGMEHTWMLFREEGRFPDDGKLASVYLTDIDLSIINSMSADWAGGGLVSTLKDTQRFLNAALTGELFESEDTLNQMRDYKPTGEEDGSEYGLGWMRLQTEDGLVLEGHGGFGGALMLREPNLAFSVVGTSNQAETEASPAAEAIGVILEDLFSE